MYIMRLLLLLCWLRTITFVVAGDQDRSECTPSHFDLFLNCSRRNLTEIPDIGPEIDRINVEVFFLEGNGITTIASESLRGYENLQEFYLGENQISCLKNGTFRDVPELKILDLSRNTLFAIAPGSFSGLENLKKIFLDHNQINFLPDWIFVNLRRIEVINLESNPLTDRSISKDTFRNLTNLKTIDMAETKLATLPDNLFQDCENLEIVLLYKTNIASVNMIHWPLEAPYKVVDLRYSPIVNITNVPKAVTNLKASLAALQCSCENERAIRLILDKQPVSSFCPDLNCSFSSDESVVTAVGHMLPSPVPTNSNSGFFHSRNNMQIGCLMLVIFIRLAFGQ